MTVNGERSRTCLQRTGVPQRSVLSVTLFAIKINSLAAMIPQKILVSLFVDDLQIIYSDHSIHNINNKLQQTIAISNWTTKNGFRMSTSKTGCMTFF